jgi:predicted transcriptional regulator
MSELKPFASLSSGLLARKGQAKPAMRPQAYGAMSVHDDLGWNDMGYPANLSAGEVEATQTVSPVVAQQAAIAEEMNAQPEIQATVEEARPADVVPILRAAKGGLLARAKAAFTLRLDPERHLKLRLACAVDHRSAQQIVTQALDEYLNAMPEIDVLAGKVPARGKH